MTQYSDTVGFSVTQIEYNKDLNRMQSFVISWQEFIQHPILGLGGDAGGSWLIQQGYDVSLFSGLSELLSRYGIIIILLFLWLLNKSCRLINKIFRTRTAYVFMGMFLVLMVGFNNWNQPIFIGIMVIL